MIITKKTAMRNNTRSARGHIIAAVDYIYRNDPPGRVGAVWASPEMADIGTDRNTIKGLMLGTAELNERARNPIRHYVITWRDGEELTPEMVNQMLTAAGVQEHQWIFVKHHDHDAEGHQHGHLLVNSIHPQTFRSNNFFNDIKIMMQEVARIAHARGWDRTDAPEYANARYRVLEDGTVEDQRLARDQAMPKERDRAKERHGTEASMETYLNAVREELFPTKDALKAVGTWQDFHAALARHGLNYETKGSGAIWKWEHEGPDGQPQTETRKASVIPSFSLKKMEKVLGPYQSAQNQEKTITGHVASPTNPATKDHAAADLTRVRSAARVTRKGIQKRQLVQSVLAYVHSTKFQKMHTTGTVAQKQIRAWESIQKAKQEAEKKRAQEEAARARAELLRRQAEAAEAERQKKARQAKEEAKRREQERIQKEKEEAQTQKMEKQEKPLANIREWVQNLQTEKAREEARAQREEERQRWAAEEQERDTMQIEIDKNFNRFMAVARTAYTYAPKPNTPDERNLYALEKAMQDTWTMSWPDPEKAKEVTATWMTKILQELGYDIDAEDVQAYIARWIYGGPENKNAYAQHWGTEAEPEEEEGPARGR